MTVRALWTVVTKEKSQQTATIRAYRNTLTALRTSTSILRPLANRCDNGAVWPYHRQGPADKTDKPCCLQCYQGGRCAGEQELWTAFHIWYRRNNSILWGRWKDTWKSESLAGSYVNDQALIREECCSERYEFYRRSYSKRT